MKRPPLLRIHGVDYREAEIEEAVNWRAAGDLALGLVAIVVALLLAAYLLP